MDTNKKKLIEEAIFRDSPDSDIVITRNGFKVNISIEEIIKRERENLADILDNVEDQDESEDKAASGAQA